MLQKLLVLSLFLVSSTFASGQLEKVIHHTFDPTDFAEIEISLLEEYELLTWSGNQILTETYIELYSASTEILRFFIEEKKRYEILVNTESGSMVLQSSDQVRQPILYRGTECSEFVKTKIYIPDSFTEAGENRLLRKE